MNNPIVDVAQTLQSAYDEQYDTNTTEWRELSASYKAKNILHVCKNMNFSKVMECGAGEGSILKFLDASGAFEKLYATEISDSGIDQIKSRNLDRLQEVRKFSGYDIPYGDKEFDMVYCSHVIEHVEHPRILLREIKRVSEYQVFEIPLDYSLTVDKQVNTFLSFGHINIFTPALFKFLLKSEGYNILAEQHSNTATEAIRFNWYRNQGKKKNLVNELKIRSIALRRLVKKVLFRKSQFNERGYSFYTCLAKAEGELKIF
ncbi:MAG: class I SAM-dependent methyltransferase [Calditrichia bacterium]